MDTCMTCESKPCCPMYDEYGTIEGCCEWKPVESLDSHKIDVRRSLDAGRPVEQGNDLSAASGFILGLAISIPIWLALIWTWKEVFR